MSDIQDILDRQAIADLVHTYAKHVRDGTAAQCGGLFTGDGIFEVRERNPHDPASDRRLFRIDGEAAIEAFIGENTAGATRICPLIHNLLIALDGDSASASCVMEGRTVPPGDDFLGEYDDALRRTPGGWRFARRTYTFLRVPG